MTEEMNEGIEFATALVTLQSELPQVRKDAEADVGQYSYKYADLSAITDALMPVLTRHGLSFTSYPTLDENGRFILRYALRHVSGEWMGGDYPLSSPDKVNSQKIGSEITYARRYALCAVTGLAPSGDDDDGKTAAIAQDSARTARPAEAPNVATTPAEWSEVNDQITEWQMKFRWPTERVFEQYAKWNKGALLAVSTLEDRRRFVQELAAHYMNETKRQERTTEDPPADTQKAAPEQARNSDEPPF